MHNMLNSSYRINTVTTPRVEIHRRRTPEHWAAGAAAFLEVVDVLVLVLELVVEAGSKVKSHEASRERTSPTELVIASVGHENSSLDCVFATTSRTVEVVRAMAVTVTSSVVVTYEEQLPVPLPLAALCLSHSARAAGAAVWDVLLDVLGGGLYESAQSVSISSVAFSELVIVSGTHEKSLASSGSANSVTVVVVRMADAEVMVNVSVTVITGQTVQTSSEPQ